ncbi:GvpL/GvpF family gas vesicle protein [Actinacidiphila sp. bgisy167]|uniref:GvpL/GvpF family gas vesicle protein n=1 Tax=Actinacidiphila sp. bgisy167 TaxID=3413797 RepID=UPI003D7042F5
MAVYVYSITSKEHPARLDGLTPVGGSDRPLRTVTSADLSAVVSEAPQDLRPRRKDVLAHQAVQERLMADGAVLPLRFGFTAPDEDAVRAVLEDRAVEYQEKLKNLEGCVEYHLKVSWDEDSLLRRILDENDEARRLNEQIRGGTASPDMPLMLGELIANEVEARQQALGAGIVEALRPFVRDDAATAPAGQDFLSVSFLVDDTKEEMFLATQLSLANQVGEECDFRLLGPLPPYSFV